MRPSSPRLAVAPITIAALAVTLACSREDDARSPAAPSVAAPPPSAPDAAAPEELPRGPSALPDAGAAVDAPAGPVRPAGGTAGCGAPATGGIYEARSVAVAAEARTYALSVPPSYDPWRAYPLVLVFHGARQSGAVAQASFGLQEIAAREAILVYPDGRGGAWDLVTDPGDNRDVALFDALTSALAAELCVDATRVFATGMSNGAYFTNQLGCWRGTPRLRAIAAHSGGGPFAEECAAAPPPALVLHGLTDGVVASASGNASLRHWLRANACSSTARASAPEPCVAYEGCARPVSACMIPGIGHEVWAHAAEAAWAFFSSQ